MKHLPNILTLLNLVCGCLAISFTMSAPAYLHTLTGEEFTPILGVEQLYLGSVFIAVAALFDMLDGWVARLMGVFSPIGKDLDSLADVVSFGVAPSMIMFKLLWMAYMAEPGALSTPLIVLLPAFALAVFAALRLAKFNQSSDKQTRFFIGAPVPSIGLLIASFPLIAWYNPMGLGDILITNRWLLYGVIACCSYLMVSKLTFLKWMPNGRGLKAWMPQIIIALTALIAIPLLNFAAVPVVFVVYSVVSQFGSKSIVSNMK